MVAMVFRYGATIFGDGVMHAYDNLFWLVSWAEQLLAFVWIPWHILDGSWLIYSLNVTRDSINRFVHLPAFRAPDEDVGTIDAWRNIIHNRSTVFDILTPLLHISSKNFHITSQHSKVVVYIIKELSYNKSAYEGRTNKSALHDSYWISWDLFVNK